MSMKGGESMKGGGVKLFLIWLAAYVAIIAVWQIVALVTGMTKMECAVITAMFELYLTYPFARYAVQSL